MFLSNGDVGSTVQSHSLQVKCLGHLTRFVWFLQNVPCSLNLLDILSFIRWIFTLVFVLLSPTIEAISACGTSSNTREIMILSISFSSAIQLYKKSIFSIFESSFEDIISDGKSMVFVRLLFSFALRQLFVSILNIQVLIFYSFLKVERCFHTARNVSWVRSRACSRSFIYAIQTLNIFGEYSM